VVEEGERRRIFTALLDELNQVSSTGRDLEEWVRGSPLFVVSFDDSGGLVPLSGGDSLGPTT
jgi:hypothetical protein